MELLPLSSFWGAALDSEYLVRSHRSGEISEPMQLSNKSFIAVSLSALGYDVLSAFPLGTVRGRRFSSIQVANFGLLGKMTGCAAIFSSQFELMENGRGHLATQLKALGTFGMFTLLSAPKRVLDVLTRTPHCRDVYFRASQIKHS